MTVKNRHSFQTITRLINKMNLHLSHGAYHTESGVIDNGVRPTFAIIARMKNGQYLAFSYRSGDKTLKNKTVMPTVSLSQARTMFAEKLKLNQVYF